MHIVLAALSGALLLAAAEEPPQAASNPVEAFLRAADVNDFAAMEAITDRDGSKFLKKINNCYWRVYQSQRPQGVIAAWMCSEGPDRSRVVIANVALTAGSKVSVVVGREDVNNRPAPERAGSAFAP
jgi:hypothetical protein